MKKKILFLMLSFYSLSTFAQKFEWAATMGGNESSAGKDIAMDKIGNVFSVGAYSAGTFIGSIPADFDPGPGQVLFSQSGNYLSKLNANGTYGFVKRFPYTFNGGVAITQIALDKIGNIFLAGHVYYTADLDPGTSTVMYTDSTTGSDLIVYKFSPLGIMQWYKIWPTTTTGYNLGSQINELELDNNGNIILVGELYGEIDFDLGPDTSSSWGNLHFVSSFLLKLDENGNYLWDYTLDLNTNSSSSNGMNNCAINNQNEIYVVGKYWEYINFFNPDTFSFTGNGFYDNFILKISETGTLQWAKSFGGGDHEGVSDIHFSNDGNLYMSASFSSPTVVLANDTNSIVLYRDSDSIIFISVLIKMNESGNYEWARQLRNSTSQWSAVGPGAVATDSIGQVYFLNTGTTGTNYTNYGIDTSSVYHTGEMCIILNKYAADGTFIRSSAATGNGRVRADAMAMNKNASIAFTGELMSTQYIVNDPNPNPIDADPDTSHFPIFSALGTGYPGIFIIKWNQCSVSTTILDTIVCNSYSLNGSNYTQSGTYNFYETSINRCDSVIVLNLTVLKPSNTSQNIQLCYGQSLTIGNDTYNQPGVYQNTLTAQNGCDSIVTTNITVNDLSAEIVSNGSQLSASNQPLNAQYQWVNCTENFAEISGATNPIYTAIANGSYAVVAEQNGCRDTSACFEVTTVGIEKTGNSFFQIFPNPASNEVFIQADVLLGKVEILDLAGRIIFSATGNANQLTIHTTEISSGFYWIKCENKVFPFIIQH